MRPLAPPNIEALKPYVPGKSPELLARQYGIANPTKLDSNESALGPSPRALAAAQAALADCHRYPDQQALRQALAEFNRVQLEQVVVGNGSNELIDLVARTFCAPGDRVVYQVPAFDCYRSAAVSLDLQRVEVPLCEHVHYELAPLLQAVEPETKLVMLGHPNNPTGGYFTEAELRRLLAKVPEDAVVVLDEAYAEFVDAPDYRSGLKLLDAHPGLIVLRTFSKAYGLAGLRVGYGVAARPELIAYISRLRAPFNVNRVALAAAVAALTDQAHLERHVAHVAVERRRVSGELAALGYSVVPSQGNFLLVKVAGSGAEVAEQLVRQGVAVRPMPAPLTEYVRVTLGRTAENDRFIAALGRDGGGGAP